MSDRILTLGVGYLDGRKIEMFDRDTPYDHVTADISGYFGANEVVKKGLFLYTI